MFSEKFIKKITSKDITISTEAIKTLIKAEDLTLFNELCSNADYLFAFIKERITKDFVKLINEEDLKIVFEYSKIYCPDFEDLIIKSWLKFASEDLTDEILELFEKGENEQKAYCAKYFMHIQDPLALEYLRKEAKSDYEPLRFNCAQVLKKFNDTEVLDEMKSLAETSDDDFEKLNALNFISIYGGKEQIKFVVERAFLSPFVLNIVSNILDFNEIEYLREIIDDETMIRIFHLIIEEYPEDLSLDTCYYWDIESFIKIIFQIDSQYAKNVLLLTREKFREFSENDIYTFDFDKNTKTTIQKVASYLNSIDLKIENLDAYQKDYELEAILGVIKELKLFEYDEFLAREFLKVNDEKKAQIALILKEFNKLDLINCQIVENIENENIKALIKSYF